VAEVGRRRRWTIEQKRRIVEETLTPGASVSVVARRYDINANLLFKWKREADAGELGGAAAPAAVAELVPIGVVGRSDDGVPTLLARIASGGDELRLPEPGRSADLEARPGMIEIDLPCGARVRVDAAVDGRALGRVLSALKRHS
jgi:transposase